MVNKQMTGQDPYSIPQSITLLRPPFIPEFTQKLKKGLDPKVVPVTPTELAESDYEGLLKASFFPADEQTKSTPTHILQFVWLPRVSVFEPFCFCYRSYSCNGNVDGYAGLLAYTTELK